jgi:hypothetical protein
MPSGIVKAVVLVDDLDAVLAVLGIVGAEPVQHFESTGAQSAVGLGWPEEHGATRGAVVGSRQGMLELVEIPAALRDTVRPGVANLSYATRDVEGAVVSFRALGLDVRGPFDFANIGGGTSTFAHVAAGGVPFEVIRYGD